MLNKQTDTQKGSKRTVRNRLVFNFQQLKSERFLPDSKIKIINTDNKNASLRAE